MARYEFGGETQGFTAVEDGTNLGSGGAPALIQAPPTTVVPFYAAATGGSVLTDFLIHDGTGFNTVATQVNVTATGHLPRFQGPDGLQVLWTPADPADPGGTRLHMRSTEALAGRVTALEAGGGGGGGDWNTMANKPVVIAAGPDAAAARSAISALSTEATSTTGLTRNTTATTRLAKLQTSGGTEKWAIDGGSTAPGQLRVNDLPRRQCLVWLPGDGDPTANGAVPAGAFHNLLVLGEGDTVPAWALAIDGTLVAQEVTDETPLTFLYHWDGVGLTDEANVQVGTAGTGDTAVAYLFSAANPVVEATSVPAQFPTGARMTRHAASATTPAHGFSVPANSTTIRARAFLRTPATWPATFPVISIKNGTGAGSDCARFILGTSGRVHVSNSANAHVLSSQNNVLANSSDYYVELALTQNATAVNGSARLYIYDTSGGTVFDSDALPDDTGSPVGYGTVHDRVYYGPISSVTTTLYMGRFAAIADPATKIGVTG